MDKNKLKIVAIIVAFLILGGCHLVRSGVSADTSNENVSQIDLMADSDEKDVAEDVFTESAGESHEEPSQVDVSTAYASAEDDVTPMQQSIFVQVCGYVVSPGVYELDKGSRMFEAIEIAGGVLEEGCTDSLWLARVVSDGDRIYVPAYGEDVSDVALRPEETGWEVTQADGTVNINTAGLLELMQLPGIGESRANDIIQYRKEHGGFQSIEDIMKVPGIKDAAFNKIKDKIRV